MSATMLIAEMQRVVVESPFKGPAVGGIDAQRIRAKGRVRNKLYLEFCLRDCIYRGESPYASHKLLTDCLDDDNPEERRLGISAGLAWRSVAAHVFYVDLGWSSGMMLAKDLYDKEGIHYEIRNLPKDSDFWKAEAEVGSRPPPPSASRSAPLGPATRTFLLDAVNEKIEEFENAENDCVREIERSENRMRDAPAEVVERLEAVRQKLTGFRAVVEELS